MEAGRERRDPQADADDEIGGGAPDPEAPEHEHEAEERGGRRQRSELEAVGVEEGHERDRAEVVEHGDREQEDAQPCRAGGADQRERPEHERGVGGDRYAEAVRPGPAEVEREVDPRRHHQAGRGGDHRQRHPAPLGELPHRELATDLESDDVEEEHHQPVVHPVAEVLPDRPLPELDAEVGRPQRLVRARERGVRPDKRHDGRREQHGRAPRLGGQEVAHGPRELARPGTDGALWRGGGGARRAHAVEYGGAVTLAPEGVQSRDGGHDA